MNLIIYKPMVATLTMVLMFAACSRQDTAQLTGGTGSLKIGQTTAWYATPGQGIAVLVWSDLPASTSGSGATATGYRGSLTSDGRRVDITCETKDGKAGKVTLAGKTYDLAAGSVFLIATKTGLPEVRQLKRDISQLEPTAKSLEQFAKNDPDLAPFVLATGKPKP
jgi:hypothetical protein